MQELLHLSFTLALLAKKLDPEAANALSAAKETVQEVSSSLRDLASDLRPPVLASFGLIVSLRGHIEQFQTRHPALHVMLLLPEREEIVSEELRFVLYRVCQQALHNIQQHAQARTVWVRLAYTPEQVTLEVQDDGRGFNVPAHWVDLARQGHFGLVGMIERVDAVGGNLTVYSQPGKGATVRATVPRTSGSAG
jgi:signal transduction histidine kinase